MGGYFYRVTAKVWQQRFGSNPQSHCQKYNASFSTDNESFWFGNLTQLNFLFIITSPNVNHGVLLLCDRAYR